MSASLARHLKDFSAPPPSIADPFEMPAAVDFASDLVQEPQIDLEEVRAEAREEGRTMMRLEMEAEHAQALAALQAENREAQAAQARAVEAEMAARIAEGFASMAADLQETLSKNVLNALMPLLDKQMAERAIESLAATVRSAFAEEGGPELVLRGPAHLADQLADRLTAADYRLRHIEAPGVDLTVEYEETVLVTRLSAWRDSVEELLR